MSARMKPRCSVWTPRLPPLWAKALSGIASVAAVEDVADGRAPRRAGGWPGRGGGRRRRPGRPSRRRRTSRRCRARARRARPASGGGSRGCRRRGGSRGRRSARGDRRPPWRPSGRSRRRAGPSRRRAPSGARGGRRRRGTGASACGRSRRSGARRGAGCGSPRRRAGRRGRRPMRPLPSTSPARPSHICVWPMRSSATLASAMSSSSAGAWPHHSETRWPRIRVELPMRSRVSKKASWPASGVGISVWWLWAAASRASSATSGVFMSGSDGITCAPLLRGCRRRSGGGRPWRWPARRAGPCRTGSRR